MKKHLIASLALVATLSAAWPPLAHAMPRWLAQVEEASNRFLQQWQHDAVAQGEQLRYELFLPDARLQFSPCETAPAVSRRSAASTGRITLSVSCRAPRAWDMNVTALVHRQLPVAVLRVPLSRAAVITASAIEYRMIDANQLRYGYFRQGTPVEGLVLRRSLPAGTPLHPGVVDPPLMVRRGDEVVISARNDYIEVKMKGVALADGRVGDQIPVRNSHSERRVQAIVVDAARVEVPL